MADVEFTSRHGVATITLNRPEQRNAMSLEMRQDVRSSLAAAGADPAIRCIVITGAAGHFMGGSDVRDFEAPARKMNPDSRRRYFEDRVTNLMPLIDAIRDNPKPIVAKVRGACVGLGFGLVNACDFAYAADTAFFSTAYVHLGAPPDGGLTHFLPLLVGTRKAMEIFSFGDRIPAAEALRLGIVNAVFAEAELEDGVGTILRRLCAAPTVAIGMTKKLIRQSSVSSLETQMADERRLFADCTATADFVEGITAFLEKRKAKFEGR
jgi:2-(1,2-epoxy-1,2-dihydrophenyl)acetyl-CoA isomerase